MTDSGPDISEEILARLKTIAAGLQGVELDIPPRTVAFLGGHFTEFDEAAAVLKARFPVKHDYRNPMRFMQGGMITAVMDNTMGPLCFLCRFFGVSTQINTAFVRPVTPDETWIEVEARIVERTANVAQVTAVTRNAAGKTVALCQATFTAMSRPPAPLPG
jgi:uncharacterized protein (TIGR00369 family)